MPGFHPNHLAHQKSHGVKELPGINSIYQFPEKRSTHGRPRSLSRAPASKPPRRRVGQLSYRACAALSDQWLLIL
eukprot:395657-Pleurochrysis_carterae.AAC.17